LDMDGTVNLGPTPVEGALEFLHFLKETGRRRLFLTNNPTSDASIYSEKLRKMGIEAAPQDILTSGEATARHLVSQTPYRRIFAIGTPSFETELERAGLIVTKDSPEAVVLAFDKTLTYAKLETACLLLREGLPYFATNPDKACPTDNGFIPDCGAIAALLEAASDRTPQYIGKPSTEMLRMALRKLNVEQSSAAMVGDRLYTDMKMARDSGVTAILVLSGETKESDLLEAVVKPDYIFPSLRELHKALLRCTK
jgi:HAD superfamily hydrolase (TIGR01450 family)